MEFFSRGAGRPREVFGPPVVRRGIRSITTPALRGAQKNLGAIDRGFGTRATEQNERPFPGRFAQFAAAGLTWTLAGWASCANCQAVRRIHRLTLHAAAVK